MYDDYDSLEGQGSDDAMIDPMQFVQSALGYGRKKFGLPTDDSGGEQEMGFDDGGVVPTEPDPEVTGGGNPNATDPRQAMAYLTGDGAVSPEIAQAFERRIDPQGGMNPTQRAITAIGVAPNDEARFGLLQHYRTKYNAYAGAAKAALSKGDMGGAAHYASMAMDNVPDGKRTQFAPAQGGLAMISQPAFRQGGGKSAPPQQSFEDGGEVEEDDETQDYSVTQQARAPDPVVATAPQEGATEPPVPDYAPEPVDNPQDTMPTQSRPEVLPAQAIAKLLDEGFDKKLEATQRRMPVGALDARDANQNAQMNGWDSAAEQRGNPPASTSMFDSRQWVKDFKGLFPAGEPPAPTTGSEAATRTDGETVPTVAAPPASGVVPTGRPAAPQPAPPTEGAVIDEDRVNPFTGQVRQKAQGAFGSRQEASRSGGVVPTGDDRQRVVRGQLGSNEVARVDAQGSKPDYERAIAAAKQATTYNSIPPKGAPATRREMAEAEETVKAQTPRKYWDNITPEQVRSAVDQIRERQRQDIIGTARGQAEAEARIANIPARQNAKYKDFLATTQSADVHVPGGNYKFAANDGLERAEIHRSKWGPNDPGVVDTYTPSDQSRRLQQPKDDGNNPYLTRLRQAQQAAAAAFPWVGADAKKRDDFIAKAMAGVEDRSTKFGVEEYRSDRAEQAEQNKETRANNLADSNMARDRQRQDAKARDSLVLGKLKAASQSERDQLRSVNEYMKLHPNASMGEILNKTQPLRSSLKLRPEELLKAAEIAGTYDPRSDSYDPKYGTGYGGPGGPAPATGGDTYLENMNPGDAAARSHKGKQYNYILSPDGREMVREDIYKQRFGGR